MPRRTKAIAESVASDGAAKTMESTSIVGRGVIHRTLSPRQGYELNIHARKAVSAIADQLAKAERRLFDRNSEEEITSGPAFDFVHHHISASLIRELVSWWNVEGEMILWKVGGLSVPQRLTCLDPGQMQMLPFGVLSPEAVTGYRYMKGNSILGVDPSVTGVTVDMTPEQVMFIKNWNPNSRLRGLAPAITGVQEISSNYYAGRYNSAFFQNGAMADLIIRFPKGTKRTDALDYVKKWEENHSVFEGRAFKVSAVIGEEMQIEKPTTTAKDGQFLELRKLNAEDIGGLFGVPPSVMGFLSRTRYDTIDVELESFFENTLLPQIEIVNAFIQCQLIDLCFGHSMGIKSRKAKMGRHCKSLFRRASSEYSPGAGQGSDTLFILDPDSLPIMAGLRKKQLEAADTYRRTMAVSFKDAAEWAGVDRPDNDADDCIYVPSDQKPVITPDMQQQEMDNAQAATNAAVAKRLEALEHPESEKVTKQRMDGLAVYYSRISEIADKGVLTRADMSNLAEGYLGEWRPKGWEIIMASDHVNLNAKEAERRNTWLELRLQQNDLRRMVENNGE